MKIHQIKLTNNIQARLYVEHLCSVFLRTLVSKQNYIPNFSILKIPNFKHIFQELGQGSWGKELGQGNSCIFQPIPCQLGFNFIIVTIK